MKQRHLNSISSALQLGVTAVMALAIVAITAPSAHAFVSKGHLWAGAGAANIGHAAPSNFGWWGPSLHLGVVTEISDFWRVTADLGASHHFSTTDEDDESIGPYTVASGALGVRYAFDVAIYVPYIGLAAAVHPMGPPSSASPQGELLSLRATIGLDYRKSRNFSFGAAAELHAPVSEPSDFPHYSSIRAHLAYHFERF